MIPLAIFLKSDNTSSFTCVLLPTFPSGSFLPLRVTEQTPLLGRSGFAGYLRWLLHSPAVTESPTSFAVREQEGGGIVASYRWAWLNITYHTCVKISSELLRVIVKNEDKMGEAWERGQNIWVTSLCEVLYSLIPRACGPTTWPGYNKARYCIVCKGFIHVLVHRLGFCRF